MSRQTWLLVFLSIVLTTLFGASLLVASFFTSAFQLSPITFGKLTLGIWGLSLVYIPGELYSRRSKKFWLKYIGAICLGLLSLSEIGRAHV